MQQELFGRRKDGQPKRKPGRKPKTGRRGSPHTTRPEIKAWQPVHIVLRVARAIGSLRKRYMYAALREATITAAMRELKEKQTGAFRIVHVSIQQDHVHLIVEADNKLALARGMQSFQISAAKHLNRAASRGQETRRRGAVFPDRYHEEVITSPRQARNTLAYVLNNWRKHREDRGVEQRTWPVDPFSTAIQFSGWKELESAMWMWRKRDTYDPLAVYLPKTWLLREGWRRHGLIDSQEVPSARLLHGT